MLASPSSSASAAAGAPRLSSGSGDATGASSRAGATTTIGGHRIDQAQPRPNITVPSSAKDLAINSAQYDASSGRARRAIFQDTPAPSAAAAVGADRGHNGTGGVCSAVTVISTGASLLSPTKAAVAAAAPGGARGAGCLGAAGKGLITGEGIGGAGTGNSRGASTNGGGHGVEGEVAKVVVVGGCFAVSPFCRVRVERNCFWSRAYVVQPLTMAISEKVVLCRCVCSVFARMSPSYARRLLFFCEQALSG